MRRSSGSVTKAHRGEERGSIGALLQGAAPLLQTRTLYLLFLSKMGVFLSQGLLTQEHSAHCYLERQRITHGQSHPRQLNHLPPLRQQFLEGFPSHAALPQDLHLLSTAGSTWRANQAVEQSISGCYAQALLAQHQSDFLKQQSLIDRAKRLRAPAPSC